MTPSAASQQSQYSSSAASTWIEGLQPPLGSALSSLNINLDYELARYRYAKRGEPQPGVAPPKFQPRRRSLNLFNVPNQTVRPNPAAKKNVTPPPPPPNPRIQQQTGAAGNVAVPPIVGAAPANLSGGNPISEVAALRSAIVHQPDRQQDTYLASSEALLEEFEPPYQGPQYDSFSHAPSKGWFENLNTPLGLGALMLLLVASAGFGFVLVNPLAAQNLISNTPLERFWPTDEEADTTADAVTEETDVTADFEGPPLNSLSPDLSRKEFAELELNNLSNLPANSTRSEVEDPSVESSNLSDEASDPLEPSRASQEALVTNGGLSREPRQVNEIPRTTTPAPQPAPVAPTYQEPPVPAPQSAPTSSEATTQPAPSTAPTGETASREPVSSYYVVTDYTGDPSLDSAREFVDEAYVRNFDVGARIQLGAFNTEEGAAALVEELQNQGLDVQIYEP